MVLLTNFVPDPSKREYYGFVSIAMTCFNLFTNLGSGIKDAILEAIHACRLRRLQRTREKLLERIEEEAKKLTLSCPNTILDKLKALEDSTAPDGSKAAIRSIALLAPAVHVEEDEESLPKKFRKELKKKLKKKQQLENERLQAQHQIENDVFKGLSSLHNAKIVES